MNQTDHKGFRRLVPLLILTAVLLAAVAVVLLLPAIKKRFPADSPTAYTYTPTYQTLAKFDSTALDTITVTHLDGTGYTLVCQDKLLSLQNATGELEPISATISDNFIKYATTLYVEDTIAEDESEVADQLSAMGLQPPQITATAVYSDGSQITISLGSNLYDTDYHYYQWSGGNSVYLCNSGVFDTFNHTADMLRTVTQPLINVSLAERISIQHENDEVIECTFSDDETGLQGTVQHPFVYPMDTAEAAKLLSAISNFRLGSRLQPLNEDTRALYGLDAPQAVVTINQRAGLYSQTTASGALQSQARDASVITFSIGDADGDFFYFCEYEGTCYRVSSFLVSAFLQADAMHYVTRQPANMGDIALTHIAVQTQSGSLDVQATYTENVLPNNELEVDEYGNIVYTTEISCNGETITADAFDALVKRLKKLSVSGSLDSACQPEGTPHWQLTLTTAQGDTRTLATYHLDMFQDILAVDGYALFYISNEALYIALGECTALLQ